MKYICEICKKTYGDVAEAEACERAHQKEKMEADAKTSAEAKINDAINAFVARYKKRPEIKLAEENQKIVLNGIEEEFKTVLDDIFDILIGNEE